MQIKGIIVPILTPMNADETIDEEGLRQEIERLLSCGVHGIFPSGTNGEGYTLNEAEKERILQYMRDISPGVSIDADGYVTKQE